MRNWTSTETDPAADSAPTTGAEGSISALQSAIGQVIKGKPEAVKLALVAFFAQGHLLIEDVPGIGKTTLANALAKVMDISFQRIQFTSDLLPSDVIGLSVYNQQSGAFEWKGGPIFANIVLADEINRATPKTQSALLEAMAEEQVTTDGVSRSLPRPFMVVATQNPMEHHGTYPLPESQMDRFMMRLSIGYPDKSHEIEIVRDRREKDPLEDLEPVASEKDARELQDAAASVRVDDALIEYLLDIVEMTRKSEGIELGVSPRGTLALYRCAQAMALVEGRDYCIADDIKRLVLPVFAHRIKTASRSGAARTGFAEAENALRDILDKVEVPI